MMKIFAGLLVTIVAIFPLTVPIYAQDRPVLPADCNKANTQMELNLCAQNRAESADKKLNNTYQILQRRLVIDLRQGNTAQINLAKTRYQKLVNAQNAWIKFRDTNCEYERSNFEGGSIAPMIYHDCVAKVTDRRTADLQEYSKQDP
jgi:uncharacterized protein YecT (DUF1311 family)